MLACSQQTIYAGLLSMTEKMLKYAKIIGGGDRHPGMCLGAAMVGAEAFFQSIEGNPDKPIMDDGNPWQRLISAVEEMHASRFTEDYVKDIFSKLVKVVTLKKRKDSQVCPRFLSFNGWVLKGDDAQQIDYIKEQSGRCHIRFPYWELEAKSESHVSDMDVRSLQVLNKMCNYQSDRDIELTTDPRVSDGLVRGQGFPDKDWQNYSDFRAHTQPKVLVSASLQLRADTKESLKQFLDTMENGSAYRVVVVTPNVPNHAFFIGKAGGAFYKIDSRICKFRADKFKVSEDLITKYEGVSPFAYEGVHVYMWQKLDYSDTISRKKVVLPVYRGEVGVSKEKSADRDNLLLRVAVRKSVLESLTELRELGVNIFRCVRDGEGDCSGSGMGLWRRHGGGAYTFMHYYANISMMPGQDSQRQQWLDLARSGPADFLETKNSEGHTAIQVAYHRGNKSFANDMEGVLKEKKVVFLEVGQASGRWSGVEEVGPVSSFKGFVKGLLDYIKKAYKKLCRYSRVGASMIKEGVSSLVSYCTGSLQWMMPKSMTPRPKSAPGLRSVGAAKVAIGGGERGRGASSRNRYTATRYS